MRGIIKKGQKRLKSWSGILKNKSTSFFDRKKIPTELVVGIIVGIVYWLASAPPSSFNSQIKIAYELLHGQLNTDWWKLIEQVTINGHNFPISPPMPAIVCVPFVLIGLLNQSVVSIVVGAIDCALIYRLVCRQSARFWFLILFAFGTNAFYESIMGQSWGLCSLVSVMFTSLALLNLERSLLLGTFAILAALSRYDLALVIPVYFLYKRRWSFWIPVTIGVAFYLLFNYAKFHTIFDPTEWLWYAQDKMIYGGASGNVYSRLGPFAAGHIPLNVFTWLFAAPGFVSVFPWVRPSSFGQSILLTSPAFLISLRAKITKENLFLFAYVGAALIMPALCWNNGCAQFGCRYWIQVYPFLILLISKTELDRLAKILIVLSVVFCISGSLIVRFYGWAS